VEHDGFRLVLDFGSGALGELQRYGSIYTVDAVVLSHLHPDHCIDMCGYYVARKYAPEGEDRPTGLLPVWGPAGTRRRVAEAYDTEAHECDAVFTFHDLVPSGAGGAGGAGAPGAPHSFELGPFTVTVTLVDHPVEAYAIRLDAGGRSLVYSGDTGPCEALNHLAEGCDLLLAEASFQEPRDDALIGVHLNGRQAGEAAAAAGAGRLVLTHIPPWTDAGLNLAAAKAAYPGVVDLARPGAEYRV
jgi:ribonuclease BN (tRNA processing enzyme)